MRTVNQGDNLATFECYLGSLLRQRGVTSGSPERHFTRRELEQARVRYQQLRQGNRAPDFTGR